MESKENKESTVGRGAKRGVAIFSEVGFPCELFLFSARGEGGASGRCV
jgi:hypothetical protein